MKSLLNPPTTRQLSSISSIMVAAASITLTMGCVAGFENDNPLEGEPNEQIGIGGIGGGGINGLCINDTNINGDFDEIADQAIVGSGNLVTRTFPLDGFDKLDGIVCTMEVEVRQAAQASLEITADDNVIDALQPSVTDAVLDLGLSGAFKDITVRVVIEMPSLTGVNASGVSVTTVTGFQSSADLALTISGVSTLSGDSVAGDAEMYINGASEVTLVGSATAATLWVNGASKVDLSAFELANLQVYLNGAGQAVVNVLGTITGQLVGGALLRYLGNPDVSGVSLIGGARLVSAQ